MKPKRTFWRKVDELVKLYLDQWKEERKKGRKERYFLTISGIKRRYHYTPMNMKRIEGKYHEWLFLFFFFFHEWLFLKKIWQLGQMEKSLTDTKYQNSIKKKWKNLIAFYLLNKTSSKESTRPRMSILGAFYWTFKEKKKINPHRCFHTIEGGECVMINWVRRLSEEKDSPEQFSSCTYRQQSFKKNKQSKYFNL